MKKQEVYFPFLDGLRAISVVLVIFVHVREKAPWLSHIQGWLGVDVFFILSGYLITTLLLREEQKSGRVDLADFYLRRFYRIIPVYLLVLTVYVAVSAGDHSKWVQMRHALPYYLTMMNEFVGKGVPFSATWTLGVEEKFYLVWPAFFFVAMKGRKRRELAMLLLYGLTLFLPFRMARSYFGLLNGCALAVILDTPWWLKTRDLLSRVSTLPLLILVLLGFYLVDRDQRWVFAFSIVIGLLVASLLLRESSSKRLLSSRPFVWVGKRSYSMYLVHGLVLNLVERLVHPSNAAAQIADAALTTAGAALLADLLLRWVEDPCRDFGKRVIKRRHKAMDRSPETLLA